MNFDADHRESITIGSSGVSETTERADNSGNDSDTAVSGTIRKDDDVLFTDGEGVIPPNQRESYLKFHEAVLESPYATFNTETGEYLFEIPLGESVDDEIQTKVNEKADEELVNTDGHWFLRGTYDNPGAVSFLLRGFLSVDPVFRT